MTLLERAKNNIDWEHDNPDFVWFGTAHLDFIIGSYNFAHSWFFANTTWRIEGICQIVKVK